MKSFILEGDALEDESSKYVPMYTIEEWKALFGTPGSGADIHGRWGGVYATEPDYCEGGDES